MLLHVGLLELQEQLGLPLPLLLLSGHHDTATCSGGCSRGEMPRNGGGARIWKVTKYPEMPPQGVFALPPERIREPGEELEKKERSVKLDGTTTLTSWLMLSPKE